MSDIRVTYSGLIGFAVAMGGILSGFAFTLIVTRQLEPQEFGIWTVIAGMIGYSIVTEPVITYWTTRQVARDEPVAKTSLVSGMFFAGGSIPVYVISIYLFTDVEPGFFGSMLFAAILIPATFMRSILSGINLGHKPHAVSMGLTVFQSVKIPAGLGLVFFLNLGLDGAIIAVFIAYVGDIVVQLRYAKPQLRIHLDFSYLKNWIKQSWIPLYRAISNALISMDVVIFTIMTGSIVGVAYYAAALVIANIVMRSAYISQALYPKLLAKGSHEYISENFVRMLYFAIPMLVTSIVFSEHALFALNPEYAHAGMAVILLAFGAIFSVITRFFYQILMGIDTVDVEKNPSMSKLLRSNLFRVSTFLNLRYISYITILVVFLYIFQDLTDIELVTAWSAMTLATSVPFMIYSGILVRQHTVFSIHYAAILKYIIGGMGMAATFVLTNEYIVTFEISIYSYLPNLILELLVCCAVYLGITCAIDRNIRRLFRLILSEIPSMRRK